MKPTSPIAARVAVFAAVVAAPYCAVAQDSLLKVPPPGQRVRLLISNRSVREALENLSGLTGLGYEITESGVRIYFAAEARVPDAPVGAERPILMIDLGDGLSLLVYPADLPPEIRASFESRRAKAIEEFVRKASAAEPAN